MVSAWFAVKWRPKTDMLTGRPWSYQTLRLGTIVHIPEKFGRSCARLLEARAAAITNTQMAVRTIHLREVRRRVDQDGLDQATSALNARRTNRLQPRRPIMHAAVGFKLRLDSYSSLRTSLSLRGRDDLRPEHVAVPVVPLRDHQRRTAALRSDHQVRQARHERPHLVRGDSVHRLLRQISSVSVLHGRHRVDPALRPEAQADRIRALPEPGIRRAPSFDRRRLAGSVHNRVNRVASMWARSAARSAI